MNRRLQRNLQTVFFMTDHRWIFVSSSIVKAAASHGGDVSELVPPNVNERLTALYRNGQMRTSTPCMDPPQGGYGRTDK